MVLEKEVPRLGIHLNLSVARLGDAPADGDGRVTGPDAVHFFTRSGLPREALSRVSAFLHAPSHASLAPLFRTQRCCRRYGSCLTTEGRATSAFTSSSRRASAQCFTPDSSPVLHHARRAHSRPPPRSAAAGDARDCALAARHAVRRRNALDAPCAPPSTPPNSPTSPPLPPFPRPPSALHHSGAACSLRGRACESRACVLTARPSSGLLRRYGRAASPSRGNGAQTLSAHSPPLLVAPLRPRPVAPRSRFRVRAAPAAAGGDSAPLLRSAGGWRNSARTHYRHSGELSAGMPLCLRAAARPSQPHSQCRHSPRRTPRARPRLSAPPCPRPRPSPCPRRPSRSSRSPTSTASGR